MTRSSVESVHCCTIGLNLFGHWDMFKWSIKRCDASKKKFAGPQVQRRVRSKALSLLSYQSTHIFVLYQFTDTLGRPNPPQFAGVVARPMCLVVSSEASLLLDGSKTTPRVSQEAPKTPPRRPKSAPRRSQVVHFN